MMVFLGVLRSIVLVKLGWGWVGRFTFGFCAMCRYAAYMIVITHAKRRDGGDSYVLKEFNLINGDYPNMVLLCNTQLQGRLDWVCLKRWVKGCWVLL